MFLEASEKILHLMIKTEKRTSSTENS